MRTYFIALVPLLLSACGAPAEGAAHVVLLVPGQECGPACDFDFGIVATPSAAHAFQLVNVGDAIADVQASLSGADFALVAPAAQLKPGALTEIAVTASPKLVAPSVGTLTMSSSTAGDDVGVTSVVHLSASIPARGLVFDGDCGFGDVPAGTTSAPCDIVLRNESADELEIDDLGVGPGAFHSVGVFAVPTFLAPDASTTASFTVTPASVGPVNGQLFVTIGGAITLTDLTANGI